MLYFIFGYDEDDTPPPKTFTQEDINRINKKANEEAAAAKAAVKEMEATLNQLRNQESLTKEEKASLEGKMKEMEERGLTEMQKLQKEFEKKEKTYTSQITEISEQYKTAVGTLHGLKIEQEITRAAIGGTHPAIDGSGKQILRILKGQTVVNEEGNVVVQGFEYDEDDKRVVADLSPEEAINKMRSMTGEWGNLFKDPKVNGTTMHNRTNQFEKSVKDQSMEEYIKNRDK